jgi:predicted esterase
MIPICSKSLLKKAGGFSWMSGFPTARISRINGDVFWGCTMRMFFWDGILSWDISWGFNGDAMGM